MEDKLPDHLLKMDELKQFVKDKYPDGENMALVKRDAFTEGYTLAVDIISQMVKHRYGK